MYQQGRCLCDQVGYQLQQKPLFVQVCHCTLCQRSSGSAFNVIMVIENSQFLSRGEGIQTFEFMGASGALYDIYSCNRCGTALWGRARQSSGVLTYVRAGTLDHGAEVKPQAQIFTGSKQAWVPLLDDVPHFEHMYELEATWPVDSQQRLSRAMLKA